MYLAHFMGAGGATKFLNARDTDGDAVAAQVFPHEAHANKSIFYDRATGKARTFDEIYDLFAHKFTGGSTSSDSQATADDTPSAEPTGAPRSLSALDALNRTLVKEQALPVFDDKNTKDDIIWNDDPRFQHHASSGFSHHKPGQQNLSPAAILTVAQMMQAAPAASSALDAYGFNS
jgi:hypothetical protein